MSVYGNEAGIDPFLYSGGNAAQNGRRIERGLP